MEFLFLTNGFIEKRKKKAITLNSLFLFLHHTQLTVYLLILSPAGSFEGLCSEISTPDRGAALPDSGVKHDQHKEQVRPAVMGRVRHICV